MKHLRYDCYQAPSPYQHAQKVMLDLGITYKHATPQSMGDQWWFWGCENVPDPLPPFLTELGLNPFDCIGYGLSAKDAKMIMEATRG